MVIDKQVALGAAMTGVADGSTILVGGFGNSGEPIELLEALRRRGARDLVIVANNGGTGHTGLAGLLEDGLVRKLICSFPRTSDPGVMQKLYADGALDLELVPQGTLAERIRAAGAGIGAFYTPTAAGTRLAEGKEERVIDGRPHVLEHALHGDVALVKADRADRWGNLVYHRAARNFNPVMATAAALTIVQVREVVPVGGLEPEEIVTPSVYIDRLVAIGAPE
jgi:3-oxoadipate CoA-transferase, alpha subunit